jgi:hypothetical protein
LSGCSIWEIPEHINLNKSETPKDYELDSATIAIGDFGYIGSFKAKRQGNNLISLKVIAKARANESRLDSKIDQEKKILTVFKDLCHFIPKVLSTFQDDRYVYMTYDDNFVCDLSLMIATGIALEVFQQSIIYIYIYIYYSIPISCLHICIVD